MKKHWIISILAIIAATGYYFAIYTHGHPQTASVAAQPSPTPPLITIAISQDAAYPMFDQIKLGIQDELKNAGYTEGNQFSYDFENAQGQSILTDSIAKKLTVGNATLLIPIGQGMSQTLARMAQQKPIIFSGVVSTASFELNPGTNATGTIHPATVQQQLELLKKLAPKAITVGIPFDPKDTNSTAFLLQAEASASALNIKILSAPLDSAAIASTTHALTKKADAILILPETPVIVQDAYIQAALAAKTAIIAANQSAVAKGALAAIGVDYYQIGRATGGIAVRIINGEKPGEISPQTLFNDGFYLNTATAKKIGITIPDEALRQAKQVYK